VIPHPPSPLLYELVGLGMTGYAQLVQRTRMLGAERLRLEPGVVLVCTHLSDADVPVLGGALYRDGGLWRDREIVRPSFAVANDLLVPGYLAGYPRGFPLPLRRLLWPLGIGPVMERWVRCLPVRFADRMRLVEALRRRPDLVLAESLPAPRVEALRRRAERLGRPAPLSGRDVLDGAYADLLWQDVRRPELNGAGLDELWEERLSESARDLRALIRLVRGGGTLVMFPHGELSTDGAVGPLDERPVRFLRSARAVAVQPLAIAHDALSRGRPRAFVGVGKALEPPGRDGGARELLAAMRRAMPLACGHVAAHALLRGEAIPSAVERAVERARAEGRHIEPELEDLDAGRRRVEEAVRAVGRLGSGHPVVRRAARTYESVVGA
jgi:1-acyl-sn-glycerol-3-phosphate acyltransferase